MNSKLYSPRLVYIRAKEKNDPTITFAWQRRENNTLDIAFARCSGKDQFSKKVGREKALARLESDNLFKFSLSVENCKKALTDFISPPSDPNREFTVRYHSLFDAGDWSILNIKGIYIERVLRNLLEFEQLSFSNIRNQIQITFGLTPMSKSKSPVAWWNGMRAGEYGDDGATLSLSKYQSEYHDIPLFEEDEKADKVLLALKNICESKDTPNFTSAIRAATDLLDSLK